jgi:hypothetical protein
MSASASVRCLIAMSHRQSSKPHIKSIYNFSSKAKASVPPKKQKKKVSKGGGAGKKDVGISDSDKIYKTMVACLDAPGRKAPRASDEEMARRAAIGRQYVIGSFEQHNELNHDISCKIKMKIFAVKMLPRGTMWKEEALKITPEGPPLYRKIPLLTPPIPGYKVSDWVKLEE